MILKTGSYLLDVGLHEMLKTPVAFIMHVQEMC